LIKPTTFQFQTEQSQLIGDGKELHHVMLARRENGKQSEEGIQV
jgi:hypothetical protein